jgi:phosphatidylglycerophosphate synthase
VLIRTDYLYDESLVKALLDKPGHALRTDTPDETVVAVHLPAGSGAAAADPDTAARVAGVEILTPVALVGAYNAALRKRARPYLVPLDTTARDDLERLSFAGAYKGATDFVTKYFWPWPARHVTRWCAGAGISPNSVTFVSLLLVILAFWLFWTGQFAIGIAAAWAMTFLDTVDGKLARVTLTSTKFGEFFDHGIDLIHPPFWYWAWYVGLATTAAAAGLDSWIIASFWIILAGYVLGRIEEGIFIGRFGIEMHVWRPVDYWFRTITARRNPNLAILTVATVAGSPTTGFMAVAVWTVFSLVFHLVRILQAFACHRAGEPIRSWLTEAE